MMSNIQSYPAQLPACFRKTSVMLFVSLLLFSCEPPLISTSPAEINDTSSITITCNARLGNRGLLNFEGPVYVHLGLITDSSSFPNDWRYVPFQWGTTEENAMATFVRNNQWSYSINNIRRFFKVPEKERIKELVVLFRSGNCVDTFCQVLRNADRSDFHIPLTSVKK